MTKRQLTVRLLRSDTWDDCETVMGTNGGARGCWCMHWRLSMDEWMEGKGDGNKAAMRKLAKCKTSPGVVAYLDDEPIAWCGYGDRSPRSATTLTRPPRRALSRPIRWSRSKGAGQGRTVP